MSLTAVGQLVTRLLGERDKLKEKMGELESEAKETAEAALVKFPTEGPYTAEYVRELVKYCEEFGIEMPDVMRKNLHRFPATELKEVLLMSRKDDSFQEVTNSESIIDFKRLSLMNEDQLSAVASEASRSHLHSRMVDEFDIINAKSQGDRVILLKTLSGAYTHKRLLMKSPPNKRIRIVVEDISASEEPKGGE